MNNRDRDIGIIASVFEFVLINSDVTGASRDNIDIIYVEPVLKFRYVYLNTSQCYYHVISVLSRDTQ